MSGKSWIAVDLDGTLAKYDGWQGYGHIGEPVQKMVDRVKELLTQGKNVKIFTARVSRKNKIGLDVAINPINRWCEQYIGQQLEITCEKDMDCVEIYDDIAKQVKYNKGEVEGEKKKVQRREKKQTTPKVKTIKKKVVKKIKKNS